MAIVRQRVCSGCHVVTLSLCSRPRFVSQCRWARCRLDRTLRKWNSGGRSSIPRTSPEPDPVKGKEELRATVQRLVDSHFNLILPWVTFGYLVALDNTDYQKSHPAAGWDALGYLIQEATRQGLAVHLWYSFTEYREADSPDFDPQVGGNPEWAARRIDELVPGYPVAKGKEYGLAEAQMLKSRSG